MHDFNTPGENESLTALLTLDDPAVLSAAHSARSILFHYPAAKLGLRPSIGFCARQLAGAARAVFARGPTAAPWVITSPPRFVLPAAANLLARELVALLVASGDSTSALAELWLDSADAPGDAPDSTRLYARAGFETRFKERSQLHQRLKPLVAEQFQGRPVLFVNDIHVTGAQQHFMRQALLAAQVPCIHWLYLVTVPPDLGRAHPEIEYELNYSRHGSFADFAELVRDGDIEFTARCIHRLFDHEESEVQAFLESLPTARRQKLIELASEEAHCQGRPRDYWEKLQRLSE